MQDDIIFYLCSTKKFTKFNNSHQVLLYISQKIPIKKNLFYQYLLVLKGLKIVCNAQPIETLTN